jgi:hypothetical protein
MNRTPDHILKETKSLNTCTNSLLVISYASILLVLLQFKGHANWCPGVVVKETKKVNFALKNNIIHLLDIVDYTNFKVNILYLVSLTS